MEEVKRKRGRPKKEGGRKVRVNLLLTDEEFEEFQNGAQSHSMSLSEIMRKGTKTYLELANYRFTNDEEESNHDNIPEDYDYYDEYYEGYDDEYYEGYDDEYSDEYGD